MIYYRVIIFIKLIIHTKIPILCNLSNTLHHQTNCFPLFLPLSDKNKGNFFNYRPLPYPKALRKSVSPLWWHGHKHSLWYLHQSVPEVPAHLSGLPRLIKGCSYKCASTGGSGSFQAPLCVSVSACI